MAINVKNIIASALLELCETKSLEALTVKQILEKSGVSRQTFYNHFIDKNDLIQYVYNMKKYHYFMKQACLMEGQNCLKDYIFNHCKEFDLKWHQELYGDEPMPESLRFATEYHATASSSMTLSWILSDMPVSCEEISKMITEMRGIGMEQLFKNGKTKGNPYKRN